MTRDWITTTDAAALTGYTADYIRGLIRAGLIRGRKWGREWQVSRTSLFSYVRKVEKLGAKRGRKRKDET